MQLSRKQNTSIHGTETDERTSETMKREVEGDLKWELRSLLQQQTGSKAGDSRQQPLDTPELDRLPIQGSSRGEQHPYTKGCQEAEGSKQECNQRRRGEPKALAESREFRQPGDFRSRRGALGPAGPAAMAVTRTNDELGPAFLAGFATFLAGNFLRSRWPPKFVANWICHLCHGKLPLT